MTKTQQKINALTFAKDKLEQALHILEMEEMGNSNEARQVRNAALMLKGYAIGLQNGTLPFITINKDAANA